MIKLDYSLQSPEERNELVKKILEENPNPPERYLEILADYLVLCMEKQEKKEKKLLTENRMTTVNKRETSYEGLVSQLENGEDGIYNLLGDNNKNVIFQPKITITKEDIETIPYLKQLRDAIEDWEKKLKKAEGREAYAIKKTIIELRKDQYIIKNDYQKPIIPQKITKSKNFPQMNSSVEIAADGTVIPEGVSFIDPKVVSAVLCNYEGLKQECEGKFDRDLWYVMYDFDILLEDALIDYPLYKKIVEYKIQGLQNVDIQELIEEEFGIRHSVEYISSLWRNKIPKLIASVAEDQYLNWYYTEVEKGKYKKCSRCGQIKLAHNKYFSKNKTSKDGFYSLCKECRNKK